MKANIQNVMNEAKIIGFTIGKLNNDAEFMEKYLSKTKTFEAISYAIEKYPDDCIALVCATDHITEEEYNPADGKTLLADVFRAISGKEIVEVFQSAK